MKTSNIWGIIVIILLVIGGIWAAKNPTGQVPAEGEVIKIGVIAPLTGPVADFGEEIRKGVQAGLVAGVEAIFEDDKCDPKEAVSAYQKLIEFNKVKFLIGPACGSPQEAIVPLLTDKEALTVVPAAASTDLFGQSGSNFYNIQYSLQDESKFIAERMLALGYNKVALVYYANAFSQTHVDSFKQNFKGQIAIESRFLDETTDVSTEVTKIGAAQVDAIYSPDISFFFANGVSKLRERKVTVPIFTTYVAELPAVRALVPDVYYSFPGDLAGAEGAVYELSKQAAELLSSAVKDCQGDYACVKDKLNSSGNFDVNGIYQRQIILKQIKNGEPVNLN